MRKVERAPNPNAKKRADTLAYGGGQRFGPFLFNWMYFVAAV